MQLTSLVTIQLVTNHSVTIQLTANQQVQQYRSSTLNRRHIAVGKQCGHCVPRRLPPQRTRDLSGLDLSAAECPCSRQPLDPMTHQRLAAGRWPRPQLRTLLRIAPPPPPSRPRPTSTSRPRPESLAQPSLLSDPDPPPQCTRRARFTRTRQRAAGRAHATPARAAPPPCRQWGAPGPHSSRPPWEAASPRRPPSQGRGRRDWRRGRSARGRREEATHHQSSCQCACVWGWPS